MSQGIESWVRTEDEPDEDGATTSSSHEEGEVGSPSVFVKEYGVTDCRHG